MTTASMKKNELGVAGDLIIDAFDNTETESGSEVRVGWNAPEDATRRQWMRLIETSRAFDFWNDPAEDIYTEEDGEPI
jgi:hypothetical protein